MLASPVSTSSVHSPDLAVGQVADHPAKELMKSLCAIWSENIQKMTEKESERRVAIYRLQTPREALEQLKIWEKQTDELVSQVKNRQLNSKEWQLTLLQAAEESEDEFIKNRVLDLVKKRIEIELDDFLVYLRSETGVAGSHFESCSNYLRLLLGHFPHLKEIHWESKVLPIVLRLQEQAITQGKEALYTLWELIPQNKREDFRLTPLAAIFADLPLKKSILTSLWQKADAPRFKKEIEILCQSILEEGDEKTFYEFALRKKKLREVCDSTLWRKWMEEGASRYWPTPDPNDLKKFFDLYLFKEKISSEKQIGSFMSSSQVIRLKDEALDRLIGCFKSWVGQTESVALMLLDYCYQEWKKNEGTLEKFLFQWPSVISYLVIYLVENMPATHKQEQLDRFMQEFRLDRPCSLMERLHVICEVEIRAEKKGLSIKKESLSISQILQICQELARLDLKIALNEIKMAEMFTWFSQSIEVIAASTEAQKAIYRFLISKTLKAPLSEETQEVIKQFFVNKLITTIEGKMTFAPLAQEETDQLSNLIEQAYQFCTGPGEKTEAAYFVLIDLLYLNARTSHVKKASVLKKLVDQISQETIFRYYGVLLHLWRLADVMDMNEAETGLVRQVRCTLCMLVARALLEEIRCPTSEEYLVDPAVLAGIEQYFVLLREHGDELGHYSQDAESMWFLDQIFEELTEYPWMQPTLVLHILKTFVDAVVKEQNAEWLPQTLKWLERAICSIDIGRGHWEGNFKKILPLLVKIGSGCKTHPQNEKYLQQIADLFLLYLTNLSSWEQTEALFISKIEGAYHALFQKDKELVDFTTPFYLYTQGLLENTKNIRLDSIKFTKGFLQLVAVCSQVKGHVAKGKPYLLLRSHWKRLEIEQRKSCLRGLIELCKTSPRLCVMDLNSQPVLLYKAIYQLVQEMLPADQQEEIVFLLCEAVLASVSSLHQEGNHPQVLGPIVSCVWCVLVKPAKEWNKKRLEEIVIKAGEMAFKVPLQYLDPEAQTAIRQWRLQKKQLR